jgi:hypothetical protein
MQSMNLAEGLARKEEGMEAAANARAGLLEIVRRLAIKIAKQYGYVHSDLLRLAMDREGFNYKNLGNASGSVFKSDQFEFTGNRIVSKLVSNHGRELKVWKLKGA